MGNTGISITSSGEQNVIGYNPTLAISNINAFRDAVSMILSRLAASYSTMMEELRDNWASPAAQEFYSESTEFLNVLKKARDDANTIINNAIVSVAEMARANGSDFHYSTEVNFRIPAVLALRENIDGYYGITVNNVNSAMLAFNTAVNEALADLPSIPDGIAVYDQHNNIKTLFSERIEALNNGIDRTTTTINANIKRTIDEQETIIGAARKRIISRIEGISPTINA